MPQISLGGDDGAEAKANVSDGFDLLVADFPDLALARTSAQSTIESFIDALTVPEGKRIAVMIKSDVLMDGETPTGLSLGVIVSLGAIPVIPDPYIPEEEG